MKIASQYIALLCLLFKNIATAWGIHDVKLIQCREGADKNIDRVQSNELCSYTESEVKYPPRRPVPGGMLLNWLYVYTLQWESQGEEPVNVSPLAGDPIWSKGGLTKLNRIMNAITDKSAEIPKTQTSFDFTFPDLAEEIEKSKGNNLTVGDVQVDGTNSVMRFALKRRGQSEWEWIFHSPMTILGYSAYGDIDGEIQAQRDDVKHDVSKKWKLGVGIGVGVGVPLLMAVAFLLGRRSRKAATPAVTVAKE